MPTNSTEPCDSQRGDVSVYCCRPVTSLKQVRGLEIPLTLVQLPVAGGCYHLQGDGKPKYFTEGKARAKQSVLIYCIFLVLFFMNLRNTGMQPKYFIIARYT